MPRATTSPARQPLSPIESTTAEKKWTTTDDIYLQRSVSTAAKNVDGEVASWITVARDFTSKSGKQITEKKARERWFNYANPSIVRLDFHPDESMYVVAYILLHGKKWSQMATTRVLTGFSENSIKNHFNTNLRKQVFDKVMEAFPLEMGKDSMGKEEGGRRTRKSKETMDIEVRLEPQIEAFIREKVLDVHVNGGGTKSSKFLRRTSPMSERDSSSGNSLEIEESDTDDSASYGFTRLNSARHSVSLRRSTTIVPRQGSSGSSSGGGGLTRDQHYSDHAAKDSMDLPSPVKQPVGLPAASEWGTSPSLSVGQSSEARPRIDHHHQYSRSPAMSMMESRPPHLQSLQSLHHAPSSSTFGTLVEGSQYHHHHYHHYYRPYRHYHQREPSLLLYHSRHRYSFERPNLEPSRRIWFDSDCHYSSPLYLPYLPSMREELAEKDN
jgi:hypothetical protein